MTGISIHLEHKKSGRNNEVVVRRSSTVYYRHANIRRKKANQITNNLKSVKDKKRIINIEDTEDLG